MFPSDCHDERSIHNLKTTLGQKCERDTENNKKMTKDGKTIWETYSEIYIFEDMCILQEYTPYSIFVY